MKKIIVLTLSLLTITLVSKAQVEIVSGGTSAAYTVPVPGTFVLTNGLQVTFKAHTANSASATLNVSGSGNISITKVGGSTVLSGSDILTNQIVTVAYDGATWQMLSAVGSTPTAPTTYWSPNGTDIYNNNAGNVGIGTTSPAQKLEVQDGHILLSNTGTQSELRFKEASANGGNIISFKAPAALASNINYTLPDNAGAANDVLTNDGAGSLSWATVSSLANAWSLTGNAISAGNLLGTTNAFDLSIIAGGTSAMTIDDVSQNIGIGVAPSTLYKIYTNIPNSNTTSHTANEIQHNYSGASTKTGVSSIVSADGSGLKRSFYGFASASGIQETVGFYSLIDNDGSGSSYGVYNDFSLSTGSGTQEGVRSIISNAGTSFKRGVFTSINQDGGANGSDMTGVHNSMASTSSASQDMFGILNQLNNSSTTGSTYGIYQTFSGTSTGTKYGVYASGEDQNYFSGSLGIGITTPSQKLHVEGGRLRVANGASSADLYQSGVNTLLETSGQFQIYANGTGPEFTIDDGNANFYVPLLIQDGSQANNRVLTSNASGYATWTDLSAISSGTTAWTKAGSDIYPTNISDFVGIGTTPTSARLSVVNNLVGGNALLITNETGGTTSVVSGTKGGRISVTANDNNPKVGLEVQVGGTGTGQQNALFVQASGAASAAFNRGLVAGATNNTSSNIAADLYADGNSGTNYGLRVFTAGTQAATKYAAYLSSSGSGTKYGVYATGENMNYFSGLMGIGTSPATTLDVANSTIVTTSRFTNTFSSGTQKMAVYGWATGTGGGANLAGAFEATGSTSTNYGVQGSAYGNSGAKVGVYGSATGTGTNTAGHFTATGGTNNYAIVVPSGGGHVGIGVNPGFPLDVRTSTEDRVTYFFNDKNTTNTTFAVYGGAYGAGSGEKRGGSFEAVNGSGTNIGVRAYASGTGTNWAAYFLGNTYIQGRLGINETVPLYDLDVSSTTTTYAGRFKNEGTGGADGLRVEVTTAASAAGTRYGTYSIVGGGLSTNYAVLGIAQTSGTTNYGVYGSASGGTTNNYGLYCAGSGGYTGTWTLISDQRFKENIKPLTGALDKILQLEPKTYNLKSREYEYMNFPTGTQIGLISQEVEKIIPELVEKASHPGSIDEKTGEPIGQPLEFKSMNYIGLTPVLVQAIKEQQLIIEQLKARIEALEKK